MVIKEFECKDHGVFEGTHPICPSLGCESEHVKQVFLTPPKIGTNATKRFDQGIRRSAEMYHIDNFRSSREGEAAYGGDAAKKAGMELLWGQDIQKITGNTIDQLAATAQRPLSVPNKQTGEAMTLTHNNGMREAATELGLTRRNLPKVGELVQHGTDIAKPDKVRSVLE